MYENMIFDEEPETPDECEHRICCEAEDDDTGEVCDNCYCDLDGYCPFSSLWEDCELFGTRVVKGTAYEKWYSLPEESLKELNKYPEFIFLRHSGYWSGVKGQNGQKKVVELLATCVCYDTTMGAIFSLLQRRFRVSVSPVDENLLEIGFIFPEDDEDFPMWTRESIEKSVNWKRKEEKEEKTCLLTEQE